MTFDEMFYLQIQGTAMGTILPRHTLHYQRASMKWNYILYSETSSLYQSQTILNKIGKDFLMIVSYFSD